MGIMLVLAVYVVALVQLQQNFDQRATKLEERLAAYEVRKDKLTQQVSDLAAVRENLAAQLSAQQQEDAAKLAAAKDAAEQARIDAEIATQKQRIVDAQQADLMQQEQARIAKKAAQAAADKAAQEAAKKAAADQAAQAAADRAAAAARQAQINAALQQQRTTRAS